jgi:hypothetical protein
MECPACKKPLSQKTAVKGASDPLTGKVPAQIVYSCTNPLCRKQFEADRRTGKLTVI